MWQAIADPETARRCWSAIEEIERGLAESPEPSPLLAGGQAGLALFFGYLEAVRKDSGAGDRAFDALGRSIEGLAEGQLLPSLYSGFCGVGWAIEHLTRELIGGGEEDLCGDLDEALAELLANPAANPEYELLNGLAGFGTYLLERLPHPAARELLGRVLDRLERSAEESESGTTWYTLPEWLLPWHREKMPAGCHNLGVAHGVPGVIGFLAAAQRKGVADPRVPRLAAGAVRWLLGRKLPADMPSTFPAMIVPGAGAEPTRVSWCYGDLGIAVVLLSAARSFGRPDWEEEALALARRAARRSEHLHDSVDSSLCHGTAGNGHFFNRLYQATGDPELRETALRWYCRALDLRRPGEGIAGFLTLMGREPGSNVLAGQAGLLTGAAGVGLALLAAVSNVEPAWDRVMLAAIPPRPRD